MRTKGLVVPHSPADALLVGIDPAGGLLAGHLSVRDRSSDSRDDGFVFPVLALCGFRRALKNPGRTSSPKLCALWTSSQALSYSRLVNVILAFGRFLGRLPPGLWVSISLRALRRGTGRCRTCRRWRGIHLFVVVPAKLLDNGDLAGGVIDLHPCLGA